MHFRPEMVFGMVAIIEPNQVVPFVVGTDSPRDRFVGIPAVMKKVTVQIGAAVSQVIKGEKIDPEFPIQNQTDRDRRPKNDNFGDSPLCIDSVFPFDFGVDCFGIFAEITEENVAPWIFRLAIVSMAIDGNPVLAIAVLVWPVAISHVVPMMHIFVKGLGDSQRHRQHDAVQPIQYPRGKVGVVDVIVRDAVDVPRNADGVDKPHADQEPPRRVRENEKQRQNIRAMKHPGDNRQCIPFCVSK